MLPFMSDDALIHQFSRDRCETAFAALVRRHLQMVFATALRQTGDRQLAEEITQNVFLALARKAGRLGGHHTVAGWLYQATLKEARLALRTRLRRERREQVAIDIGHLHQDDADAELAGLVPMLDEALANLREPERLAVILRYLEEKSWSEVGAVLGLSEDAARKRVERALGTLGQFFARHGFKVSAVALTTGLSGQATAAVPATLAAAVTQAAVAKTVTATSTGILLGHLMNLTKTQTTLATLLVCAAPIAYEANAVRENERTNASLSQQLAALQTDWESIEERRRRLERELSSMNRTLAELNAPSPEFEPSPTLIASSQKPAGPVGWRDELPYVEVPKQLLKEIGIPSLDHAGRLQEQIIDALAMTPEEASRVQDVVAGAQRQWSALEAASARYEPRFSPSHRDIHAMEMMSYRFPALPDQAVDAKTRITASLANILGVERANLFMHHSQSIDYLTNGKGRPERVVSLLRTGNPQSPVTVVISTGFEGQGRGTESYSLGSKPGHLQGSVLGIPEFLRPIAVRWFYNDLAR